MAQNHDIDEILSTVSDETFVKEDWNCVFRECKKLSAHWHDLGAHLGLDVDDLECIRKDNRNDSKACLKKALYEWIKQNYSTTKYGLPSWKTLLEAVADVDKHLFKKLAEKYKVTMHLHGKIFTNRIGSGSSTSTTEIEASISSITKSEQQWPSQDAPLPKKRIHRGYDIQAVADQNTIVSSSPKHSQVPISSVPHNNILESSANTAAKFSPLKKGASEGSGDSFHLRVSRSEASKHTRKLVRSFPESPGDKPIEEQSLAIDSTFLQGFSLADNAESYTQPDYRRSCCQLSVPTIASAESFTQPNRSRSSGQLYILSSVESYTEPDCSRSSGQLYVPETFMQPERSSSSSQLYVPTNIYAESSINPDHSRSSGQLHISTNADLFIKLCFDQPRLIVHLRKATNLPKDFHKGIHCDPFVVLHLEPSREETFQSKVIKGTRDPEFRQKFQFEGMSVESIKLQTLVLRIYNRALNNKTIGKVCLPINDIELDGSSMKMKITNTEEMESNYQGDLLLSLEYDPLSHTLAGVISRATCLTKCDIFGKSDPYVKVIVSHCDTKVYKFKTSVKNKTLAPVYNEPFSYQILEEMSMDKVTVSFFVIDYDLAKRNDVIGVVNVGRKVTSKLGREHWNQVLQSPRKEVSFWHPVQLATSAQKRRIRSRSLSPAPL